MLLMLLLLPTRMVAETDSDNTSYKAYAEFNKGTLTFKCGTSKPAEAYELNVGKHMPMWTAQSENIRMVVFDSSFANARPTSCHYWFAYCTNLTKIEGIENLNTENVTYMDKMFYQCSNLSSLDLSNFNTEKVTDMYEMFRKCSALTTIFASEKFVTGQVTEGRDMFFGCEKLKGYSERKTDHTYANCRYGYFTPVFEYAEFDEGTGTLTFRRGVSKPEGAYDLNEENSKPGWFVNQTENIRKVVFDASFANARPTSCCLWFCECSNLTTIEGIEYLNTERVTNMNCMFFECKALASLDVSKFNTGKVTDMSGMFYGCSALASLDVSKFNTGNVMFMTDMFGCSALASLDVSKFNTAKVVDMYGMFEGCSALTSLDLTNFNTAKVTNMCNMFDGCSALTTIYASDNFVTGKASKSDNMFSGCTKLKGFIEQNKNTDKTDCTYANYKTGYFTKLVGKNGDEKIGAAGENLATENLVLDDDKDFVAYEPFAAKTASYSRTIKTGTTWGTLCLPFEVSLANQNFRAFKLLSADEGTETVELEELKTIEDGTPVIIKMKDGETKLNFSVANKEIAKDVQTAATADGNYQFKGLYTQKEFSKDADNNCYIVKGNKLMNPTKLLENTNVKKVASNPFRAYMVDNSSAPASGAKMFSIGFDDSITTIDTINTIANDKAEYYDLQGKRLNEPQKGINIVKRGGKTMKVIIK